MSGFHDKDADKVVADLVSDADNGLSSEEAASRLAEYGRNELPKEKKRSSFWLFFRQLNNRLNYVLFAAAAISFVSGHQNDSYAILIVVFMNAGFGFWQERKAGMAIEKLRQMVVFEASVMRDGKTHRVDSALLVPGDVILLEEGGKVPADARLISGKDLRADESALTGESSGSVKNPEPVRSDAGISDMTDMVWMGTSIVAGMGRAVVTKTGLATQFGSIAASLQDIKQEKAPLEARVDALGRNLGIAAVVLAVAVFLFGLMSGSGLGEMFFFTVALVVSTIPEGLPAVMAIVLAIGVRRMAKRNAIIKHVPSVETLGVADVICTDKTGTLTENKMTVREVATSCLNYRVTGEGWEPVGDLYLEKKKIRPAENAHLNVLFRVAAVCNKARLVRRDDKASMIGDSTEGAMVVVAAKAGFNKDELMGEYRVIDEMPFSSSRMYRAMLVESDDHQGKPKRQVFAVGALEVLARRSTHIASEEGQVPIDQGGLDCIEASNERMAAGAMRVIALACREADSAQDSLGDHDVRDLALLGIVGMIDPPRAGVAEAVADARRAGVRVIMSTGDQKATAIAIAREIGIIDGSGQQEKKSGVYTDSDVGRMDDEEFDQAVRDAVIFARVSPATKLRVVERLQAMGHTVAMTGDGVNDAPALKRASIGVAMGITGTDVSKDVSDMILADDNFVSIVGAIKEGRIVFRNIKQTVAYLFMTNIGEVVTVLASIAMRFPLPLLPAQILWMNLVTDSSPALALATEKRSASVLNEPPRPKNAPIISKNVMILAAVASVLMCAGTLLLFKWTIDRSDLQHARTVAFTTMAMFQLWNVFNMRSIKESIFRIGFFTNVYVLLAIAVSLSLQFAVLYLPPLQDIFRTVPLGLADWSAIVVVSSSVLFAVELYKVMLRRGHIPKSWI